MLMENELSKNKWKDVSSCWRQRLYIEGIRHPLSLRFLSVGNFPCMSLHSTNDFEGVISMLQREWAQWGWLIVFSLYKKASLGDKSPDSVHNQTRQPGSPDVRTFTFSTMQTLLHKDWCHSLGMLVDQPVFDHHTKHKAKSLCSHQSPPSILNYLS